MGIAPISDPRFVVAVVIDDPRGEDYFGGDIAAPVFASIAQDLLRLYNVRPDALSSEARVSKAMFSVRPGEET